MLHTVKIAGVQMRSFNGEVGTNLQKAESLVTQAAQAGAQLVVLPELFRSYCASAGRFSTRWCWSLPAVVPGNTINCIPGDGNGPTFAPEMVLSWPTPTWGSWGS